MADHIMPNMNGIEFLSELSENHSLIHVRKVLITGQASHEDTINAELLAAQGSAVDIGGYYRPDETKATAAMRASATLNGIIDAI